MTIAEDAVETIPVSLTALELLERVLGPDAEMRPGQRRLTVDVDETLRGGNPLNGQAPTGVGKSLGYLTPAALATTRGERTLVVTESIALQLQLIRKDLPRVAAALEATTGRTLKFSVLKGKSNYACHLRLAELASSLRDACGEMVLTTSAGTTDGLNSIVTVPQTVIDRLRGPDGEAIMAALKLRGEGPHLASLLEWTNRQLAAGGDGDKADAGQVAEEWQSVSISSSECPGAKECVYGEVCKAEKAKERAGESDIVVANTAMFGIHSALGIPVIDGSRKIGWFDHIIVDEAHTLPTAVRQAGSLELSGRTINQIAHALEGIFTPNDPLIEGCRNWSDQVAQLLETIHLRHGKGASGDVTLPKRSAFGTMERVELQNLAAWLKHTIGRIGSIPVGGNIKMMSSVTRAERRLQTVRTTILALLKSDGVDVQVDDPGDGSDTSASAIVEMVSSGVARWVEPAEINGRPAGFVLRVQPISVAARLQRFGWTGAQRPDGEDDDDEGYSDDSPAVEFAGGVRDERELSVVCVSATLPPAFPFEAGTAKGTGRNVRTYESPYAAAYGASRLYLPVLTSSDTKRLFSEGRGGKPELSYTEHRKWVIEQTIAMVKASKGRALVLSATSAGAKAYVEALRAARLPGIEILSQWDRDRAVVEEFRTNRHSVLVGTRSLFTGLDVQGDALSLVIVDRIPRAAGNRLDDSRAEALAERAGIGAWQAKASIYGGDAAVLLEQAAGRLIRSINDRGLVAILDPRLACPAPYRYGNDALKLYLAGLEAFDRRLHTLAEASLFLSTI